MFLTHIYLIPLLPAFGAAIMFFFGRKLQKSTVSAVCVGTIVLAFIMSCGAVMQYTAWANTHDHQPFEKVVYTWLGTDTGHTNYLTHSGTGASFRADAGFLLDPLSSIWLLFVTGVGMLIHIYSTGYMAHEGGYYRFFGYLNLFMFSMLTLILANNYVLLFVGWEGVGLCSYLLIGFYFHRKSASDAANKAFIVNRNGDAGFILGMFFIAWLLRLAALHRRQPVRALGQSLARNLDLHHRRHSASVRRSLRQVRATPALHLAARRHGGPHSRQRPHPRRHHGHRRRLHGRPLQRTFHSRSHFDEDGRHRRSLHSPVRRLHRPRSKRHQARARLLHRAHLGYMFLALGVGAFSAGVFHVFTHAFFKALLFLGAGSVIHAMSGEQDMRNMGDLRKRIPVTYWTMLIATLAIAGIPPFAGFFSKDEILWQTWTSEGGAYRILWVVGYVTALMTAFYMFRLIWLTFYSKPRMSHEVEHHIHESPKSMTMPLVVLAVMSLFAGFLGWPHSLGGSDRFAHFLDPVFARGEAKVLVEEGKASQLAAGEKEEEHTSSTEYLLMFLSVAAAGAGL